MFSSTGVVVHPRRWQWVLAKCAIVMDMMAVGALIVVMLIRAVLLMLPFQLPEQFGWVAWYLAAFAALTVNLLPSHYRSCCPRCSSVVFPARRPAPGENRS